MKNTMIKDVMIPISDYMTIKEEDTLYDVFQILEKNKKESTKHAHRDAIVINDKGEFKGKVTMIDLFRALEPNYKTLMKDYKKGVLKKEYVMKAVKEFNLWLEPIQSLCERGSSMKVSEIMHIPEDHEYIQEEDSFEKALHEYVMGVHQPLIVKKGDKVTGLLRFGDLFEIVRKQMLACSV
ncbi:MAG: CBS domain-containing protein [Desulfobulbaceae bacterium]|nr:CBS domain-containing protein [Desulfobulbaceae bacterium]